MYDYLIAPVNRLGNAVRKLEEISNYLDLLKDCELAGLEVVIRGL